MQVLGLLLNQLGVLLKLKASLHSFEAIGCAGGLFVVDQFLFFVLCFVDMHLNVFVAHVDVFYLLLV